MKRMRKKVLREKLERKLEKYGLRIQKLADHAYKLRQVLESMTAKENNDAVHQSGSEGQTGGGATYPGARGIELLDNIVADPSVAEQPSELPVDK